MHLDQMTYDDVALRRERIHFECSQHDRQNRRKCPYESAKHLKEAWTAQGLAVFRTKMSIYSRATVVDASGQATR